MSSGNLRVKGDRIVDGNGQPIILRGAAIGGWMNMENFITGFPGHECEHRASMRAVLGDENYEYFFDKFLEYFFTEADAKFFASLRLNCIRIPFNYRRFEDDMNPRVLKESGFKHLDRVIDLCAQHHIYTILDMHAVPGGQNPDWHADNVTNYSAFWDFKDHQDRAVWLWEQMAMRYKDNAWVAGYNPLNEPCDPTSDPAQKKLPRFYERVEKAIRNIDPHHILFLDGNTFAMEWIGFDSVLPNCVYSVHDYSSMGFPTGEQYEGTPRQKQKLEAQYARKAEFMKQYGVPVWNGEFGPVYADPMHDADAESINQTRYNLLGAQLAIYDRQQISWSIWLYKDIGMQGMLYTDPQSAWNTRIQSFLDKKRTCRLDAWGVHRSPESEAAVNPLVQWIDQVCPQAKSAYPWKNTERQVLRAVVQTFLSAQLSDEFAANFRGADKQALDELARSFHFDQCVQRQGLNDILTQHAELAGH